MPPLPSTTQSLTNRLNSLSESNKGVLQLIQRLSKLDFQPGTTPLNAEEGDARLELSAEIHENLKQIEDDLELLRQEVEDVVQINGSATRRRDSTRDSERARLAVLLARLTEDLKSCVVSHTLKAIWLLILSRQIALSIPQSPNNRKAQRRPRKAQRTGTPLLQHPVRLLDAHLYPAPPSK